MRTSKHKKNRWLLIAVYLILAAVLLTAGMKIYGYLRENQESRAAQEKYAKEAVQVNPLRAMLNSDEWNEAGLIVTSSPQTDSADAETKEKADSGVLKTEQEFGSRSYEAGSELSAAQNDGNEANRENEAIADIQPEDPVYVIDSLADTEKARTYLDEVRDLLKATDAQTRSMIEVLYTEYRCQM